MAKVCAAITTYNEAETIGDVVSYFTERQIPCFVVDNCSTDGTADVAASAGADVYLFRSTLGEGLMMLYELGLHSEVQYLIQIDAGVSHLPEESGNLLKTAIVRDADLVIGSRFVQGADYIGRRWRAAVSALFGTACRLLTGVKIYDWTSGYRVFSRHALSLLSRFRPRCRWHAIQAEILYYLLSRRAACVESPITYIAGRSSLKANRALEALRLLMTIRRI